MSSLNPQDLLSLQFIEGSSYGTLHNNSLPSVFASSAIILHKLGIPTTFFDSYTNLLHMSLYTQPKVLVFPIYFWYN